MASFSELLTQEQSNPTAALLSILVSRRLDYDVVVAVEGDDDKVFYYDFLKGYLPETDLMFIDCKGKQSVLKLRDLVSEYEWRSQPTILYLCDKDYDDFLGKKVPQVFYLPYYSIESYFGCPDFMAYVIEKYSPPQYLKSDREKLKSEAASLFAKFSRRLCILSAILMELRRQGSNADFDKLSIEKLLDIKAQDPKCLPRKWKTIRAMLQLDERFHSKDVLTIARKFRQLDARLWLRGKLALQVARISLRIAITKSRPKTTRGKDLSSRISSDSLDQAKLYLGELPELKLYCSQSKPTPKQAVKVRRKRAT